jgi:hypothetical protein
MAEYAGIIDKLSITNTITSDVKHDGSIPSFLEMKDNHVKFVHYPDCQQLIIWLPQYGRNYDIIRLWNKTKHRLVEESLVASRLNGSIQILWDTLPLAPASYTVEIIWRSGYKHEISFIKREEGYSKVEPKKEVPASLPQSSQTEPIVYMDGLGISMANEDLELARKVRKDISRKFSRRLEYEGNFRAGTIIYRDSDIAIRFTHEMGGGNCMFYVEIPTEQEWETITKTALTDRKSIVEYMAETLKSQQASSSRYVIEDNQITFYRH